MITRHIWRKCLPDRLLARLHGEGWPLVRRPMGLRPLCWHPGCHGGSGLHTLVASWLRPLVHVRAIRTRISIVIADGHPITLAGLDALLARAPDFVVLARCADGHETVRAVNVYRPDILVLDQEMPVMHGVAIVKHLRREGWTTRVVLLATTGNHHQLQEAVHLGVQGVLSKNVDPRRLVRCMREVHAGRKVYPPLANLASTKQGRVRALDGLTRRQIEVACAAVSGLSNKELAERLGVSEGTIKNHLHSIYERLQLDGRLPLLLYVNEHLGHFAAPHRALVQTRHERRGVEASPSPANRGEVTAGAIAWSRSLMRTIRRYD